MARRLCIIPARGGSKRIPGKNIKPFCGKPIIEYSIHNALKSDLFDVVMVSTDSEAIAKIAKSAGAEVPFLRSNEAADDYSTTLDVIREVLDQYHKRDQVFDFVCCLYATAPLVEPTDLIAGFSKLVEQDLDSVFPISQFSFPIWRGLTIKEDKLEMIWPENQNSRSQDLPPAYHDAGQWYWLKSSKIGNTLLNQNTSYILLDNLKVQDIDTPEDWILAELKYQNHYG